MIKYYWNISIAFLKLGACIIGQHDNRSLTNKYKECNRCKQVFKKDVFGKWVKYYGVIPGVKVTMPKTEKLLK